MSPSSALTEENVDELARLLPELRNDGVSDRDEASKGQHGEKQFGGHVVVTSNSSKMKSMSDVKRYSYPVLKPDNYDYPESRFQVDISLSQEEATTGLSVVAHFDLFDLDLEESIKVGRAKYVLLVESFSTRFSAAFDTSDKTIRHVFKAGELAGRVTIFGCVVATRSFEMANWGGWNECYKGKYFDISEGHVLAEGKLKSYLVESAEEDVLHSIFAMSPDPMMIDGTWRCDLLRHSATLHFSEADYRRFQKARKRANESLDAGNLLNAVYFPALLFAMEQGDRDVDEYQSYRWFKSLNTKLKEWKLDMLGNGRDRLRDAQVLLEHPFGRLPAISG